MKHSPENPVTTNTTKGATADVDTRPSQSAEVVASFDSDLIPPVDDAEPAKKVPARGRRMRVLGQGEGDYCIYAISDGGDLPLGTLVPMPGVPRFQSTNEARRWIVADSGDLLANRQIMIFKACDIISVTTKATTTIQLVAKMKIPKPVDTQEVP